MIGFKLMYRIYFALLVLISTTAFGETPYESRFTNHWGAECKAPFGPYQVSFDSAGDPTDDDMTMSIKSGSGNSVPVPLKLSLFVSGRIVPSIASQCDNINTMTFPSGDILLLVKRDDRPLPDRLSAVLLRAKDGAVLDSVLDLGVGGEQLSQRDGQVRIKLGSFGKQFQSKGGRPKEGWLALSEVDGKIKAAGK